MPFRSSWLTSLRRLAPILGAAGVAGLTLAPTFGQDLLLPVPPEIEGRWSGEARHGTETAIVGFEFRRQDDGRILARVWLPNVNAYGSPIGWVTMADGHPAIREFNIPLLLQDDTLTGTLYLPGLTFTVRRTTDRLPTEPEPPSVDPGPAPAWVYAAGAPLWATPVVRQGIAYVGDVGGTCHAVRVADGNAQWTAAIGAAMYGAAAVTDDAVYCVSDDGQLTRLDRRSGARQWRVALGGAGIRSVPSLLAQEWDFSTAAPVLDGDTLYVGSADGVVHALAADTGRSQWSFRTGGKIRAAAAVAGARVYVGSMDHFVYALDRESGAKLWSFDTGSPVTSSPVVAGDKVVVGTRDQSLLTALDAATGRKLWSVFFWMSWVESTPALADGLLYVGSSDSRRIREIEPDTGKVRWSAQVWGWTWGTPLVVGDTVYYGTAGAPQYFVNQKASLGALDRATGELKWRKPIPLLDKGYVSGIAGSLAYANGKLLVANLDGTLTAYPVGR